MTIRFRTSWNGHEFGTIATLDSPTETRLVTAGIAETYGGESYSDVPAVLRFDADGTLLGIVSVNPLTRAETVGAVGGGGGISTLAAATDKASIDLPTVNDPLRSALGAKADVALVGIGGTEITASRDLTAADFGGPVLNINSASAVAITVPTVAVMSLTATAGQGRVAAFYIKGAGAVSFAGKTSSTTINGTVGPTTVLPGSYGGSGGEAVARGKHYVLTQTDVGADSWTLE